MRRPLYSLLLLVACGGEPDPQPAFSVALGADALTGAAPLVVNFSASVPGGGNEVGYTWRFGDGVTAQGSPNRAYTYTVPGTYSVTLTATSGGQSAEATATVTVTPPVTPPPPENAPPSVSLTASRTTGRAPVAVTFTATATDPDGDPLTYSFNFGDGETSSGEAAQAHRYAEPGRYVATVNVADGRGGVAGAEVTVSVLDPEPEVPPTEPPPTPENEAPTVELDANAAAGTAPLTVSFSAEADDPEGDDLAYAWDFGNGETADGNSSRTLTYTEPGDYTAAVTVSDGLAETTADVLVTVEAPSAPPPPENAAPSVSVSADPADGAAPLDVTLSAEADDPDGDELAYLWDFGDGTISGENPASHLYREAGTYTASVTVSDRKGGKARAELTVTAAGGGSGGSDVPFYGQWAWAATGAAQGPLSGYLNVSEASTADDAGVDDFFVEGGKGAWANCKGGGDTCAPDGEGRIDVLDFGGSRTFDIVFVDGATGEDRLVAFDDDDRLENEDGAPTFRGGGAWFRGDGSSDDLSFVMVKVASEPAAALEAARAKASRSR